MELSRNSRDSNNDRRPVSMETELAEATDGLSLLYTLLTWMKIIIHVWRQRFVVRAIDRSCLVFNLRFLTQMERALILKPILESQTNRRHTLRSVYKLSTR